MINMALHLDLHDQAPRNVEYGRLEDPEPCALHKNM